MIITDEKILRQISRPTTIKEVEALGLIKKLITANKTAWTDGAGLAAIQIGVCLRFGWYKIGSREGILLNPVIINKWGSDTAAEGCLSIPDKWPRVARAWTIEYESNGKKRTVSGFEARVIQHEVDHMDGILNYDHHSRHQNGFNSVYECKCEKPLKCGHDVVNPNCMGCHKPIKLL